MPSTFTRNAGIEKPGNGEQNGTWGDTANLNFDIIDRAINGVAAISLSGTSSTLSTSDGALSDGQHKVLILGGSPSGTHTITLSPNDAQKLYFVRNTTGQSVIFTQGSGGNVTIPAGDAAIIYANGAGATSQVYNIADDLIMASVKITGGSITGITDLAVADGGTGVSTLTGIVKGNGASAFSAAVEGTDYAGPITGGASTIATANLTASRALASDGSGKVAVSTVTATELGHVGGVTSGIQSQLNGKQPLATKLTNLAAMSTAAGFVAQTGDDSFAKRSITGTANQIAVTNGNGVSANPTLSLPSDIIVPGSVTSVADNDGTFSTGTYTPTPADGNFKRILNAGAFTLAAPSASGDYTLIIQITNDTGAGAITMSGFSKVAGDSFTTVVGDDFFVYVTKCNGFTCAVVQALQ
jgi:hypothetical protein